MAFAVGRMGLSLETYLGLTPVQFGLVLKEWKAEREAVELLQYQVARWQVWRTLCPPTEKKEYSVVDILELPGDNINIMSEKVEESSEERFQQLKKRLG